MVKHVRSISNTHDLSAYESYVLFLYALAIL